MVWNLSSLVAHRGWVAAIVTGAVLGLAVATVAAEPSPGPASSVAPNEEWIVDDVTTESGGGIFLIHPDGTDGHVIVDDPDSAWYFPDWSPDGSKLATARSTPSPRPILMAAVARRSPRATHPACISFTPHGPRTAPRSRSTAWMSWTASSGAA